mgnify:FL=1
MKCHKENCDTASVAERCLCEQHKTIYEAKIETVKAIARFINDGGGSFRNCLYEYMGEDDYCGFLEAGLMEITNFIFSSECD